MLAWERRVTWGEQQGGAPGRKRGQETARSAGEEVNHSSM